MPTDYEKPTEQIAIELPYIRVVFKKVNPVSMSVMKTLFHKIGTTLPNELHGTKDLFLSALVPRKYHERPIPLVRLLMRSFLNMISFLTIGAAAWMSVDDERVCLLEGFSGAAYTPPSLYFAARALPMDVFQRLRETKICTISSATVRDPPKAFSKAGTTYGDAPKSFTFNELGLKPKKTKDGYPVVVEHAPIHMHCSVDKIVDLDGDEQALVILLVDTFVIDGSVLSEPTEDMKKRPDVTAKIDAQLIKPVVSFGQGWVCPLKNVHSMPRPVKQENGKWISEDFNIAESTLGPGNFETCEWTFKEHGGTCPLGYNALTALIMPRPIGWISTYRNDGHIPHIAPYSFFSDVARCGDKPMVAFSGFRRNNGETPKDAEQDAIDTGYFAYYGYRAFGRSNEFVGC